MVRWQRLAALAMRGQTSGSPKSRSTSASMARISAAAAKPEEAAGVSSSFSYADALPQDRFPSSLSLDLGKSQIRGNIRRVEQAINLCQWIETWN